MTREDRLVFCKVCTRRGFNPNVGIICSLTNEIPSFIDTCPSYHENSREIFYEQTKVENAKAETKKGINRGRYVLFILGAINLTYGIYEAFFQLNFELSFITGIIDGIVGLVFIGLGVLSFYKASLSMIIGIVFYGSMILLLAVIDFTTLFQGLILKVIIIFNLIYGIRTAREDEAKNQVKSVDLLDQI